MSYVDDIRENNESLIDSAEAAVQTAVRTCPGLIRPALQEWADRQAFGLGSLIPDGWVDEAADVVIEIVLAALQTCQDAVDSMREANRYLGSPDTLRAAADALGDIGSKADAIQIDKSQLPGWVSWDDPPASNSYTGSIDAQVEPLSRVSGTASSIADALDSHANDIENYYLQLAAMIGGGVIAILGVVSAILGVIGALPTGGVSLAASIVGIVAAILGIFTFIIGALQMFLASTQGTDAKLNALPATITTWEAPAFAMVQ